MNVTAPLFDAGETVVRPFREVTPVMPTVTGDEVTGVAGVVLWGPLLDRLNLVGVADDRRLRPIGPGGFTGGECYRTLIEVLLAGGDFLSDRSLLAGATQRLRGDHVLPSHTTLWRFCAGADLGRVSKAAAVNRTVLARAWAMGAGPTGGLVTIDPDATMVTTYGPGKHGSTFSYKGETGLSPLIGVCGETGDVLALRARSGNAAPGRAMGGFIRECAAAIPAAVRAVSNLWVRVDSAGYQHDVFRAAEQLGAVFTVTAPQHDNVRAATIALATDPDTVWTPALNAEADKGSEIADTTITIGKTTRDRRTLRLIVRRQPTRHGDQLSLDDLDIDHILPQTWSTHWSLADGSMVSTQEVGDARLLSLTATELTDKAKAIARREASVPTIGNLTMVHYGVNRSVQNREFSVKRQALFEHSNLQLNRTLTAATLWNEPEIQKRAEMLFEHALRLWPRPSA